MAHTGNANTNAIANTNASDFPADIKVRDPNADNRLGNGAQVKAGKGEENADDFPSEDRLGADGSASTSGKVTANSDLSTDDQTAPDGEQENADEKARQENELSNGL